MKVYITKYALTGPLIEAEADPRPDASIYTKPPGWLLSTAFKSDEWAETIEEAEIQFEKKRQKKIASLRKQIAKLEKAKLRLPRADQDLNPPQPTNDDDN